jgi:ubiquinone/menaquinone biosynthesis C-methylase UbiE
MINQCRKPSGGLGRFILWTMNRRHSGVTDWGLSHISVQKTDTVLDIGCGGGRTIGKLAAMASEGRVSGIDYSETSVATARRVNARTIERGQVDIRHGSVSQLPFPENEFNVVTAVETHFYWPNLPADMREVLRVLKPGGVFLLIAEIYRGANTRIGKLADKHLPMAGMALLTEDEHRALFSDAGYLDVQVAVEPGKGWICAQGRKPAG